jgi:hypothetical protein
MQIGGRNKYSRCSYHARDAACVGEVGTLVGSQLPTLAIKAMGRGCDGRTRLDKYGFSRGY